MKVVESLVLSTESAKDSAFVQGVVRQLVQALGTRWGKLECIVRQESGWFVDEEGERHDVVRITAEAELHSPIVAECDGCGADVVQGEPHDCPVLGTIVTVERVDDAP